jgi:hypothetical protein
MTSFTIEPSGPFSLAAARDFAGGFAAGIGAHQTDNGILMTFPIEGWRDSAAVDVWQDADGRPQAIGRESDSARWSALAFGRSADVLGTPHLAPSIVLRQ